MFKIVCRKNKKHKIRKIKKFSESIFLGIKNIKFHINIFYILSNFFI